MGTSRETWMPKVAGGLRGSPGLSWAHGAPGPGICQAVWPAVVLRSLPPSSASLSGARTENAGGPGWGTLVHYSTGAAHGDGR